MEAALYAVKMLSTFDSSLHVTVSSLLYAGRFSMLLQTILFTNSRSHAILKREDQYCYNSLHN